MGSTERRNRETEEIRQKIIAAATQLFIEEGYANVSMRKIAQKIEYSPTTIYIYFQNKEEILRELLDHGTALFLDYIQKAFAAPAPDSLTRLRAGLKAYIQFGLDQPAFYRLMFIDNLEAFLQKAMCGNDRLQGFALLVEHIAELIDQGQCREQDEQLIGQSMWASIHGLTSLLITYEHHFPWNEQEVLIRYHLDTLLGSFVRK